MRFPFPARCRARCLETTSRKRSIGKAAPERVPPAGCVPTFDARRRALSGSRLDGSLSIGPCSSTKYPRFRVAALLRCEIRPFVLSTPAARPKGSGFHLVTRPTTRIRGRGCCFAGKRCDHHAHVVGAKVRRALPLWALCASVPIFEPQACVARLCCQFRPQPPEYPGAKPLQWFGQR